MNESEMPDPMPDRTSGRLEVEGLLNKLDVQEAAQEKEAISNATFEEIIRMRQKGHSYEEIIAAFEEQGGLEKLLTPEHLAVFKGYAEKEKPNE